MTAPDIKQYVSPAGAEITTQLALGTSDPGGVSTPVAVEFINNKGGAGADTAIGWQLTALARSTGFPDYQGDTVEPMEFSWPQVRTIAGTIGATTVATSAWLSLGKGRALILPDLPNDSGVTLEFRLGPPGGTNNADVEFSFRVAARRTIDVGAGPRNTHGAGLLTGIFDAERSALMHRDLAHVGVIENPAGVDNAVQVSDISWVGAGIPYASLEHLETLSNLDGDSAALVATEAYYALLCADVDGTINQVKGQKAVTPLGPSDEPGLPALCVPLALVLVEFDALINDADIIVRMAPGLATVTDASLDATVSRFRAIIGNNLVELNSEQTVTLTDDEENYLYAIPDGTIVVLAQAAAPTGADAPDPLAILLWHLTTAAGVVTVTEDLRPYSHMGYRVEQIRLPLADLSTAGSATLGQNHYIAQTRGYILPVAGILFSIEDNPGSAADTIVDINKKDNAAGAYTTVFTGQGTEDRRPTIAFNAATREDRTAFPEVLEVDVGDRFDVEVDAQTTTSQPSAGGVVVNVAHL